MHERLSSLVSVLAVGTLVASASKRLGVPYNVALVLVGLALVILDVLPPTPLDSQLVLVVILPLLVFEGALFADTDGLRRAAAPIVALAVPGVIISLLGTAALAMWFVGFSFSAALLLGALLSITDTVSVLLAFRSASVPRQLQSIMEGESLFNDGTALVLVSVTTTMLLQGSFELGFAVRGMTVAIGGGIAVGAAGGALGALVIRKAADHLIAVLASIVLTFGTALLAESIHASPVIAVVIAGVAVGRSARAVLEPATVLALKGFWATVGFLLNVLVFELVGMQLRTSDLIAEAGPILLTLVALHVGRAIAVYGSFAAFGRWLGARTPLRWQHVMVVGNIKGALCMAAVLALPQTTPFRDRLITIVFGVTFLTLVTQALPFRRVLHWLGVSASAGHSAIDHAKATLLGARHGQIALDELMQAGVLSQRDHAERRAVLQREAIDAERILRDVSARHERDHVADVAVLLAQKAALQEAAQRGLISDYSAEERVASIDSRLIALATEES